MLPQVVEVIKKYGTNDPNDIALDLGIQVKYAPLIAVRGIYLKLLNQKFIIIESRQTKDCQNVILAHELGHFFLHGRGSHILETDILTETQRKQRELEANKFAFLLISHTCLRNNINMINGHTRRKNVIF